MGAEITVVRVTTNTTNVQLVEQITVVQAAPATVAISGGAAAVATDAIWDAKGDLAVGTGANTAAKLTVGTDGYVLTADAAQATGVKWAAAGGGASTLDDLTDVTITAAASGDIIRHNGSAWVDTPGTDHFEAAGAVSTHLSDTTSVHGIADTSVLLTTGSSIDALSDVTLVAAASGDLLRHNGSAWVDYPDSNFAAASHSHAASAITSGTIDTARLGSGTANSSSYLRGDQTWATISGGSADPQSGALFFGIAAYGGF
jgi:hypothetical protein